MSLRQELYDSIPSLYEDAQKYRDLIEEVNWDEPHLLELMASRIRFSVPGVRGASDEESWNAVFAEVLDYRKSKSFNYMVDRTLYRPREMIEFATRAVDEARARGAFPVDYSVLTEAENLYSTAGPGHRGRVPVPISRAFECLRAFPRSPLHNGTGSARGDHHGDLFGG